MTRLNEILESRFLFSQLDSLGLHPAPKDSNWVDELPPGVLREAASRLLKLSNTDPDKLPEGVTPEIATQALFELYSLHQSGGK